MLCHGYNADNSIKTALWYLSRNTSLNASHHIGGTPPTKGLVWSSITPCPLAAWQPCRAVQQVTKSSSLFILLLASTDLLPPRADRHLEKDDAKQGGDERICSQMLRANVSGHSLGRGYWGYNPACGWVSDGLGKERLGKKSMGKGSGSNGQGGKGQEETGGCKN